MQERRMKCKINERKNKVAWSIKMHQRGPRTWKAIDVDQRKSCFPISSGEKSFIFCMFSNYKGTKKY